MYTLSALQESLASPEDSVDLSTLAELWQCVDIRVVCRRPSDLEEHPDLAVRIRGAFGRALAQLPPPIIHRADPFRRPPPFAILFGDYVDERNAPLPKPFVIDADVKKQRRHRRASVLVARVRGSSGLRGAFDRRGDHPADVAVAEGGHERSLSG